MTAAVSRKFVFAKNANALIVILVPAIHCYWVFENEFYEQIHHTMQTQASTTKITQSSSQTSHNFVISKDVTDYSPSHVEMELLSHNCLSK